MIELTKENFDAEVASGVTLVDFWSPKCEPCMALLPEVEAFAEKNSGKAKFGKLDTAGNRRLSIAQKVMGIPTIVLYKDGEKAHVFDKESIDFDVIQAKLDELLG
ncbi:MAG: thioredoxin family protein [Defluviitaleaceae bacterium]|nr:thioredoxin family protein [Defluviitaleaceae bacterium]